MKAAAFDYVRASSLPHALELLAEHGMDAKLVAGGQSLVPMMAMRLARPAVLVDINRLEELKHLHIQTECVRMGAALRQRDVELHPTLHRQLPLVRDALRWVGHVQTRNRGTVGGSLVHADPSAELPLAALVLGARMHLRGPGGAARVVNAADFFIGAMFTAVGDTECLFEIEWPVRALPAGQRITTAFDETAMREGDFAMASAACQLQLDEAGICQRAAIGLGGMDGVPLAFPGLAAQLVGQRVTSSLALDIAHAAAKRTEPGSDLHADAGYRRELGTVLMQRVLQRAGALH